MRYRDPFTIFPKTLESGNKIYYYTTYDGFNRRKQYSTGCAKVSDAKRYCYELFRKNRLVATREIKFSTYVKNWYIYDKCPYIQSRLVRGHSYSKTSARLNRSILENVVIPYFGNLYIKDISVSHIEKWVLELSKRKVTNLTVNHYIKPTFRS
jgi:hypothetical protein